MLIILGILSILAGCFVFSQAYTLLRIATMLSRDTTAGAMFAVVAIALILSGIFTIASKDGSKRSFLVRSSWMCFIAFLVSVLHFSYGDLALWTFVAGGLFVFYIIRLWRSNPISTSDPTKPAEYINPDNSNKNA